MSASTTSVAAAVPDLLKCIWLTPPHPLPQPEAHNHCLTCLSLCSAEAFWHNEKNWLITWSLILHRPLHFEPGLFTATDMCHRWRPGGELLTKSLQGSGCVFVGRSAKMKIHCSVKLPRVPWWDHDRANSACFRAPARLRLILFILLQHDTQWVILLGCNIIFAATQDA